jgi:hypothetical protein
MATERKHNEKRVVNLIILVQIFSVIIIAIVRPKRGATFNLQNYIKKHKKQTFSTHYLLTVSGFSSKSDHFFHQTEEKVVQKR